MSFNLNFIKLMAYSNLQEKKSFDYFSQLFNALKQPYSTCKQWDTCGPATFYVWLAKTYNH